MPGKPVVLLIRDGWGIAPNGEAAAEQEGNAALLARTPFHDHLYGSYPMSRVSASGLDVGLPDGQMGNSEVGHMNLGAGRVVYQDLTRINRCIEAGELGDNEVLKEAFSKAADTRLHLLGLVSDGGVHSHLDHLLAVVAEAKQAGVEDIYVHAITDGRDTSPTGGEEYVGRVESAIAEHGARIATVVGRYYAMDRDRRWERNQIAWDAIVHGKGPSSRLLPSEAIAEAYRNDQTDEFIEPIVFENPGEQRIRDGDVVLWFNFRADRARQLSEAFLFDDFDGFDLRGPVPKVHYATFTEYDERYEVPVVFPPQTIEDGLGETISRAGLRQLRIAETEKYPHVSYFFNGGEETPYKGEDREVVASPQVATYDLQPEMSAPGVTDTLLAGLANYDFVVVNFANPDMVGHTGDVEAAIKAVETIDGMVENIVGQVLKLGGSLLVTADHGNCELMRNRDGSPHTAHTTNLVHFLYVAGDADGYRLEDGVLADIAPTVLELLGIDQPAAMTGKSLLVKRAAAAADRPDGQPRRL